MHSIVLALGIARVLGCSAKPMAARGFWRSRARWGVRFRSTWASRVALFDARYLRYFSRSGSFIAR